MSLVDAVWIGGVVHDSSEFVGGYGWMEENFSAKIKKYGIENDVVITGYVSDNVLANLYRYCYAYVYTTWYEGFGLPVLEAMNFAKPIIASNVTSVPEVAGEAAIQN